jgi:hypothetical protein
MRSSFGADRFDVIGESLSPIAIETRSPSPA